MPWLPSLPFFPTTSLPEVVWLGSALAACILAVRSYRLSSDSRTRLKNGVRFTSGAVCCLTGFLAALSPPPLIPTFLSLLTPITIAFACAGMALVSVIDVQAEEPTRPLSIIDLDRLRRALGQ